MTADRPRWLLIDTVVAAALTATMIGWSRRHGLMAMPPQFDDVAYLRWGLYRLTYFHRGIGPLLQSLRAVPAHSPFSDLLAMAAFAVFGVHDWVPYASDGLLVLMALRLLRGLMPATPACVRWSVVAVTVSLPVTREMVLTFRPDIFYGLMTAATLIYVTTRPLPAGGQRAWLAAGRLFGLLLLVKPSVYPQTIAVVGWGLTLRSVRDVFGPVPRVSTGRAVVAGLAVLAVGAVLAGPHYVVGGSGITQYIRDVVFSPRGKLWQRDMPLWGQATFYLTGTGGQAMLGRGVPILLGLWAGLAGAAFVAADRGRRWDMIALFAAVAAVYLIPTLNKTKSSFLGTAFQWSIPLTAAWLANEVFAGPRRAWARWSAGAACGAAGACGVALFRWPAPISTEMIAARTTTVDQLWAAVSPHVTGQPEPVKLGMLSMGSMINPDLFGYLGLKADGQFLDSGPYPQQDEADPWDADAVIDASDVVIASEPGTGEVELALSSSKIQDRTLAVARSREDLQQVAAVPGVGGGRFFVFVKRGLAVDKLPPFAGLDRLDLSPVEGPYPEYHLPAVRIGLGDKSELQFTAPAAGRYALLIKADAAVPGQTMAIKLNGREVRRSQVSSLAFGRTQVWLDATLGVNRLEFDYSAHDTHDRRPKAVLFQSVRVVPEGQLR